MKRRIGLSVKVGLVFYLITFLLIVCLGVMLYGYFRNTVEQSLVSTMDVAVESNANAVEDLFSRIDVYMRLVNSENGAFLDTLLDSGEDLFEAFPKYVRMKDLLRSNLSVTFGSLISSCSSCLIVDRGMPFSKIMSQLTLSTFINYPSSPISYITLDEPYADQAWYAAALENKGENFWFTLDEMPGMLYVARHISAAQVTGNQLHRYDIGVMTVGFDASWIETQLRNSRLSGESTVLLLGSGGQVVYASDRRNEGLTLDQLGLTPGAESGRFLSSVGEKSQYVWINRLKSDLQMVTLLPRAEISALSWGSMRIFFVSVPLILAAGLALIIVFSRAVVRPIRRLSLHMRSAALTPIECGTPMASDEVTALCDSFNSQILKIQTLIEEVRASEREKKRAEIQMLQAQINPHFVYNTLDSVCCKALMKGEDDIVEMLSDLADILRYNLKEPNELTTLARELQMVESYVRIQQARRLDPISIRVAVEECAKDWPVPKLLIQPLVENAIIHSDRVPAIEIRATVEQGGALLRLQVLNDQPDVDVDRINAHLNSPNGLPQNSKSTGFGVRNIDRRIRMTYGDTYRLHFYHNEVGHMVAEITLPQTPEADGAPRDA